MGYVSVIVKNFVSIDVILFYIIFFQRVQIFFPYKRMGRANVLYTFILENFWIKFGLKT
jgi:hypothetical protein